MTVRHPAPLQCPSRRARLAGAALAAALVAHPAVARAGDRAVDEVEVALAYNVLKFVEWPHGAPVRESATVDLCVLGDPSLAAVAAVHLAGRSLGGKEVRVRETADLPASLGCHAVFLDAEGEADVERTAFLLAQAGTLTFGRGPAAARAGVVFGFRPEGGRIRIDVNLDAARRAGVTVSSKLLALARVVGEGRR